MSVIFASHILFEKVIEYEHCSVVFLKVQVKYKKVT